MVYLKTFFYFWLCSIKWLYKRYRSNFLFYPDSLIKGMEAENEEERAEAMGKVDQYLDNITSLPKSNSTTINRTVINKYKNENEQVFKIKQTLLNLLCYAILFNSLFTYNIHLSSDTDWRKINHKYVESNLWNTILPKYCRIWHILPRYSIKKLYMPFYWQIIFKFLNFFDCRIIHNFTKFSKAIKF